MADAAVSRTPVEVWREIIDWVLFDPILFLTDPFYPGCNLHSTLIDFSDHQRLVDLSFQWATLRLVSRPWRNAVDRSPWQYFEPSRDDYKCLQYSTSQLKSARRLEFYKSREDHILANTQLCYACQDDYLEVEDDTMEYLLRLTNGPVRAKILRVSLSLRGQNAYSSSINQLVDALPHLRALFLTTYTSPTLSLLNLFSRLEYMRLQLHLEPGDFTMVAPRGYSFPVLKTLQVEMIKYSMADLFVSWEMPLLTHLHLKNAKGGRLLASIQTELDRIGANLVSLRLQSNEGFFSLPENIWKTMPRLEYLGVSRLMETPIPPPLGHPLHTFADLEGFTPSDVSYSIVEDWGMLSAFADLHNWKKAPDDFTGWDGPFDLNHFHVDVDWCWMCIKTFYMSCRQRGLRYEDCTGRTFEEVWPGEVITPLESMAKDPVEHRSPSVIASDVLPTYLW